ncbi:MAG: DUF1926 domain-containing protein [Chloroflexi bacterium]|nr:DUF1926 domain-containing protein [Chloroflexota bacterium]
MTVNRIFLGLALHNHQPVGNFPWVFESAYQDSYLPMVAALEAHPGVRLTLHYTGPLLDYLTAHHPEFFPRLRALVARGQVEIMTGGYYEPILPIIPDADKIGQIRKLTEFVAREFGAEATGLWLAERVWEPHLPRPLAEAGVAWTVLDDSHFLMAGLESDDLLGYYLTEEQNQRVQIFPTLTPLRYSIPWRPVPEVIEMLRGMATPEGDRIAVMGDDGEKFGTWPGTRDYCWVEHGGWIDAFFTALEAEASWLQTIPLGEYARRFPPRGRIYLPTASYPEMLEWALPAARSAAYHQAVEELQRQGRTDLLRFLRGGFWRNFLVKYPESNTMHKKMLRVHEKVQQARARGVPEGDGGQDELWQAQCNCPYWHGVFGGLYLTDIRAATFQHLLRGENQADATLRGPGPWLEPLVQDVDADGQDEILVEGSAQNLYLDPAEGGSLVEWDLRRPTFNVQSTLTRRPEPYHATVRIEATTPAEESGQVHSIHDAIQARDPALRDALAYDAYRRNSLVDHFLPDHATVGDLRQARYEEQGDFAGQPYTGAVDQREDGLGVRLWREGTIRQGDRRVPLRVEKRLDVPLGAEALSVEYTLTNLGSEAVLGVFAPEWNLNLLGGGNPNAYLDVVSDDPQTVRLDSMGQVDGVARARVGNHHLGLHLELAPDQKTSLWWYPIETVSNSEGGVERTYQGTCLLTPVSFFLGPADTLRLRLSWSFSS